MARSTDCWTSGLKLRMVPRKTTSSGMTFQASPPWNWVTLTTAESQGWRVRLTTVCKRLDKLAAGDDGVHALVGHGGVAAVAPYGNFKAAGAGHHRPGHHRHLAHGYPGQLCRP